MNTRPSFKWVMVLLGSFIILNFQNCTPNKFTSNEIIQSNLSSEIGEASTEENTLTLPVNPPATESDIDITECPEDSIMSNGICVKNPLKLSCDLSRIARSTSAEYPEGIDFKLAKAIRYSYCLILERDPLNPADIANVGGDYSGLIYWLTRMNSTSSTKVDIAKKLLNSSEFKSSNIFNGSIEQFVRKTLYQGFLNREVNQNDFLNGNIWWVTEIEKRISSKINCPQGFQATGLNSQLVIKYCALASAANDLLGSSEFSVINPEFQNTKSYVERLFLKIFDRDPYQLNKLNLKDGGVGFFVALNDNLKDGGSFSINKVLSNLYISFENQTKLNDKNLAAKKFVGNLYMKFFMRDPLQEIGCINKETQNTQQCGASYWEKRAINSENWETIVFEFLENQRAKEELRNVHKDIY